MTSCKDSSVTSTPASSTANTGELDVMFSGLQVGALQVRNRFFHSGMTRSRGLYPTALHVAYYSQRAPYCGLMVTEAIQIEAAHGSEWPYAPGLYLKEQVDGWKAVTKAVHSAGGLIAAQLWHAGRVCHPLHQGGKPAQAPSAIQAKGGKFRLLAGSPGYQMPCAIDDPEEYVALFKTAAINAKEAGFDAVQLHGCNGYLIHQFLDPSSNQRNDQWGGSVRNRCRFALRCIDVLIDVWGADRVSIKLNPAGGYNDSRQTDHHTCCSSTTQLAALLTRTFLVIALL